MGEKGWKRRKMIIYFNIFSCQEHVLPIEHHLMLAKCQHQTNSTANLTSKVNYSGKCSTAVVEDWEQIKTANSVF